MKVTRAVGEKILDVSQSEGAALRWHLRQASHDTAFAWVSCNRLSASEALTQIQVTGWRSKTPHASPTRTDPKCFLLLRRAEEKERGRAVGEGIGYSVHNGSSFLVHGPPRPTNLISARSRRIGTRLALEEKQPSRQSVKVECVRIPQRNLLTLTFILHALKNQRL